MNGSPGCVRAGACGASLLCIACVHALLPEPAARADALYALVVGLGYGHLLGAALALRRRASRRGEVARRAFLAGAVALLFALYASALPRVPGLLALLLGASSWHTVENDLALRALCARRRGVPALPGELDSHLVAAGATLLLLALFAGSAPPPELVRGAGFAAAAPAAAWLRGLAALAGLLLLARGRQARAGLGLAVAAALLPTAPAPLAFAELFALAGLYHVFSWVGIGVLRGRLRALWRAHLPPALVCAVCFLVAPAEAPLRAWLFSPAVYLFWSVLHVVQTTLARARQAP